MAFRYADSGGALRLSALGRATALACLLANPLGLIFGQQRTGESDTLTEPRGQSYYHFALGHLYHQFVEQYGRPEYYDRAVAEYEAALAKDPGSVVIRLAMMELFAGTNRLAKAVGLADEILEKDAENVEVRRLLGGIYRGYYGRDRQSPKREYLEKAIDQFEKLVELEPDNPANHLDLGRLKVLAGDPRTATEILRRAVELEPGNLDARVSLAYLLLERGRIEAAITELERVVEQGSTSRQHLNALAGAYEQAGRTEDAADLYERLIREGGNTLRVRQRLAENLFRSGRLERALGLYADLAEVDPQEAEYFLRIAMIQRSQKNFDEAREALERAQTIDPNSLQVELEGIALLSAEGRVADAIERLAKVLESGRKDEYSPNELRRRLMLLERLGVLYRENGEPGRAVAAFEEIYALDGDLRPRALVQVIETWRMARDFERAELEASRASDDFPDNIVLANLLAGILSDRGKTKQAIKAAERMAAAGADDLEVALATARIYGKAKQFEKAKQALDRASAMVRTDQARIAVLFAFGSMHERAKEYDKAEARFRELLKLAPDNSGALNYLGYMFADRGMHLDEAHNLIQKALDLEPDNGAYLDSLGWVYYRQNKLDLAAKFLEKSLEQYKDDPVVHTHLGDVYFKLGRVADAKRHWSRGLEEWRRSAPAERDAGEVESLRRKLAELEVSLAEEDQAPEQEHGVER